MANTRLTNAILAQLQGYADNNDRYDYWSLLANLGDSYAKLALDVVTGGSEFGYVANNYAASYVPGSSANPALANAWDTQAWWGVGVSLMNADLQERRNAIQANTDPLNLSFQAIEGYHQQVFIDLGIGPSAWTPYIPFLSYITANTTNSWAAANQQWMDAIHSGTIGATWTYVKNLANSEAQSGLGQAAAWFTTVTQITLSYTSELLQEGGNAQQISLRNADYVNGWSYDPASGHWYSFIQTFSPTGPVETFATAALAQSLNQERQARLTEFGAHALQITGPLAQLRDPASSIYIGSQRTSSAHWNGVRVAAAEAAAAGVSRLLRVDCGECSQGRSRSAAQRKPCLGGRACGGTPAIPVGSFRC